MKTTKRILGLIIAFTMIIPLISMQTIFALSWYHMESLRFDQIYADVVNISIDVKKNENLCYMFTLSAPSEPTDPYSTVTWINLAGFTLTPTGEIRANIDGQWLNTETEGQEIGKLAADKQWHNITIKYRNTNKTAAIYLDGVKLTTCDYMQRVNTLGAAAPQCNMVTVSGDSKDKGINGLEYKLKSVTGSNEGEMTAVLSELNEENCELTVDFSERPKGSIRGAYLQNVNIEAEESPVALTQKSVTGTSVTFGYSGSLSKFQKYALVLPDDINGSDNGILSNRYIYFTSCGGIEEDVRKFSDYTNYVNTVDVTFQQARIVDDATYGKSLEMVKVNDGQASYDTWNWNGQGATNAPTGDGKSSVSFDAKALRSDLHMAYELAMPGDSLTNEDFNIIWDTNGNLLANVGFPSDGWTTNHGDEFGFKGTIVGTYKADEWINFRMDIDKTVSPYTVSLYINNEFVKSFSNNKWTSKGTSSFSRFRELKHWVNSANTDPMHNTTIGSQGDALMQFDNFKASIYKELQEPLTAEFEDVNGNISGPYAQISRRLKSVSLNFDRQMSETSVNSGSVKLWYNGTEVEYNTEDAHYDRVKMAYIITPTELPGADAEVKITCEGAVDANGKVLDSFACAVTAGNQEGFSVDTLGMINEDGKKAEAVSGNLYADSMATNLSDKDREIKISIMGYKDGVMTAYDTDIIQVLAGESITANKDKNPVTVLAGGLSGVRVMVQDAETGMPLFVSEMLGDEGEAAENICKIKAEPGEGLAIEVYAPGKAAENLGSASDFREVIVYQTQAKADSDGNYETAFNIDYPSAVSGNYKAIVSGDKGTEDKIDIFYVNPATHKDVLENSLMPELNAGDKDGAANVILEKKYDLYINDGYIDEAVAGDAAGLLIEYIKKDSLTENNSEVVINKAVGIAAFEQKKLSDILGESELFALDSSEIKDYYNKSYIDNETKEDLNNRMSEIEFSSINQFDESLSEMFMLAVVANPAEPESAIKVMKGLGVTGYTTAQYKAVIGNDFDSKKDLVKALKAAKSDEKSDNKHTGGGGGFGGSGGQQLFVGSEDEVQNIPDETESNNAFVDLGEVLWAEEAIEYLVAKGIVNGKEYRRFYPMDTVTREEFTKMLIEAFEIEIIDGKSGFEDVNAAEWYVKYVITAYNSGIVNGYTDTIFGIGENITRQDMAVMCCRAADKAGKMLVQVREAELFDDDNSIADYAKSSIYVLKEQGIINGVGGNMFAPYNTATRAEAAKMIYEIIS